MKKPHIAVLIMMKNEEKRLHVTLESVVGNVDSIVVYDTGSTDNTLTILKEFSKKHKIPLRLKEGVFVNFSESRNILIDFADTFDDIDFILFMDVNDELREGKKLKKFAEEEMNSKNNAYLMCQHWFSGTYNKYFNNRFIKARKGWRYQGSIHEWLCGDNVKDPLVCKMNDDIVLYQDRTQDDDKSSKRFIKDKELLLIDYNKNPEEPRTLFYLAQTYACLTDKEEAFYYYKLRSEVEGFQEEKFHAFLKCGDLSEKLKHDWYTSFSFYMKALEHSDRVEPLIKIAEHYKMNNKWKLAYTFVKLACSLNYPTDAILFVDKYSYDYTRWHLMGVIAYYCGEYADGKNACIKAIEAGLNTEIDKRNLEFYEKKENELSDIITNINKTNFLKQAIEEIKKDNKSIGMKKLQKLALNKWKNRNKSI
jgi:glycosyltransferase involved in cell wall biosynthesis